MDNGGVINEEEYIGGLAASLAASATFMVMSTASANDKLDQLSQSDENWVMPGKDYHSDNFSKLTQINANNVKNLKVSWSFSTGLLNGHEGAPLVVDGVMYVHTSFRITRLRSGWTIPAQFYGKTSRSRIRRPVRSRAATSSIGASLTGPAIPRRRH